MLTLEELEHKEKVLREDFKHKLAKLDVDGDNMMEDVKCVKTFGMLWHLTHQLLTAELNENDPCGSTTADTMNIQATGLKMIGGSK